MGTYFMECICVKEFKERMKMRLLYNQIEVQKKELNYLVMEYGFSHPKVIDLSQKLDLLIYEVMEKCKSTIKK